MLMFCGLRERAEMMNDNKDFVGLELIILRPGEEPQYQVMFFNGDLFDEVEQAAFEAGKMLTPVVDDEGEGCWWKVERFSDE